MTPLSIIVLMSSDHSTNLPRFRSAKTSGGNVEGGSSKAYISIGAKFYFLVFVSAIFRKRVPELWSSFATNGGPQLHRV